MDYKELCEGIRNPGTPFDTRSLKRTAQLLTRHQLKVNQGPAPKAPLPRATSLFAATVCKTNPTELAGFGLNYHHISIPILGVAYYI